MIRSDFHMHTTFCDGKNTAEEMVQAAIEQGLTEIGFSGHAHMPFDEDWCMTQEATLAYTAELKRLRRKYASSISIHIGLEYDYYSDFTTEDVEYIIGSVHNVEHNGFIRSVEDTPQILTDFVNEQYAGDYIACAEDYYKSIADITSKIHIDIVGHFDIITKFNEGDKLFDTSSERYKLAWRQAADKLMEAGCVFEINTGAMSRGYRSKPYPAAEILDYIGSGGGRFILSSDSHSISMLRYYFEECERYVREHGYKLIDSFDEIKN